MTSTSSASQVPGGVDEDVAPSNMNQVLWAIETRGNPAEDIDILKSTWSTWWGALGFKRASPRLWALED